jgi:HAD superfamily hydrolase (TIGR01509 family)
MNFQAIIFDMDGVLADSEPLWDDIDAAMLRLHGVSYAGEHKHHVLGKGFPLALAFYKEQYQLEATIEELTQQRLGIAAEYYATRIEAFSDAATLLPMLRERGFKLGLATSSLSTLALSFLDRYHLRDYFHAIVTGEDVQRGKPNPDIYLKAAQKLNVEPKYCLVVEDSLAGVQAGKSAGMPVAAIPDPRFVNIEDFKNKADFILARLGEVAKLVEH